MEREAEQIWLSVIAKSLALLAMHRSELGNSDLIVRADFLEKLGVPRSDVAMLLGSSVESLGVMFSRKKAKRSKRDASKTKRRATK